jgi:hypothetical protein
MTSKFQLNEKVSYGGIIFVVKRISLYGDHFTYDIVEYATFNNILLLNIQEEKLEKV